MAIKKEFSFYKPKSFYTSQNTTKMGVHYSTPTKHQKECINNMQNSITIAHISITGTHALSEVETAIFESLLLFVVVLEHFIIYRNRTERRQEMVEVMRKLEGLIVCTARENTMISPRFTLVCEVYINLLKYGMQALAQYITDEEYGILYRSLDIYRSGTESILCVHKLGERARKENSVPMATVVE
jgi:hypothetical protein